jgi:hypothetical protein
VTTGLVGARPDQAALAGVLRTLSDLGYPLLSVACAPTAPPGGTDRRSP